MEWDDACLSFHENKRAVITASHDQVRQPIYTSALKAWKPYEQYLKPLENSLRPVLTEHNR